MTRRKETWQLFYPTYGSIRYQGGNEMVVSVELDKFPTRDIELILSEADAIRLHKNLEDFITFTRQSKAGTGETS